MSVKWRKEATGGFPNVYTVVIGGETFLAGVTLSNQSLLAGIIFLGINTFLPFANGRTWSLF